MKRALMLGCLFIVSGCGGQSRPPSLDVPPDDRPSLSEPADCALADTDRAMLDAVNIARASSRSCGGQRYAAAPALKWSCPLATAASRHSRDMATHDFMSHIGSDGLKLGDRVSAVGYSWSAIGENVAAGQRSVDTVMQSWLQSPGHCANIMNPAYRDLGAAFAASGNSRYSPYWTQVFGRSR